MTGRDIVPYDARVLGSPGALAPENMARNRARVERGLWPKLKSTLGRLPFLEEAVSAYFCAVDPRTPRPVKAMLLAALAYFVVPGDMIPDFVAGLGFTDDATVLFATLRMVAAHITAEHRADATRRLQELGLRPTEAKSTRPQGETPD